MLQVMFNKFIETFGAMQYSPAFMWKSEFKI